MPHGFLRCVFCSPIVCYLDIVCEGLNSVFTHEFTHGLLNRYLEVAFKLLEQRILINLGYRCDERLAHSQVD